MAEDDAGFGRQWATWALLGLNVSVFLAMMLAGASPWVVGIGALAGSGGVEPAHVWSGEIWRLLTACFVHLGIWHLALNMWVLMQLGRALENMIGGPRLLLIYASSGVFGFASSVSVRAIPTAGASGAIFGVTGALLAIALLARNRHVGRLLFSALIPFVGATLVLGFLVPFIDNTAHIGGLIFGFLIGYGLSAGDRSFLDDMDVADADVPHEGVRSEGASVVGPREVVLGTTALLAAGLVFTLVVVYAARPAMSPRYHAVAGLEDLSHKHIDEAKKHGLKAAKLAPEDPATFFLLGRIKGESGDRVEERRLLRIGLAKLADRIGDTDMEKVMAEAQSSLSLFGGDADIPYDDVKTVNALCDAAIEAVGATPSPMVKNDCAWLKLKAPPVHDPKAAFALAQAAVFESGGKIPTIVQTLSEAYAQNGDPAEALAIVEKLSALGETEGFPGGADFLDSERKRFKKLVNDAKPKEQGGAP